MNAEPIQGFRDDQHLSLPGALGGFFGVRTGNAPAVEQI